MNSFNTFWKKCIEIKFRRKHKSQNKGKQILKKGGNRHGEFYFS
jgi:hypothetical protein